MMCQVILTPYAQFPDQSSKGEALRPLKFVKAPQGERTERTEEAWIFYGSASCKSRGNLSGLTKMLARELGKRVLVLMTPETITSQICPCDAWIEKAYRPQMKCLHNKIR